MSDKSVKKVDRRAFVYAGIGVAIAAVGGTAAYFATRPPEVRVVEKPIEKTIVQTTIQTVEKPVEKTVVQTATVEKPVEKTVEKTVMATPTPATTPARPPYTGPMRMLINVGVTTSFAAKKFVEWGKQIGREIELVQPPYSQLRDKVMTNLLAQDDRFDLFFTLDDWIMMVARGMAPLDDLAQKHGADLSVFPQGAKDILSLDGRLYGWPWESGPPALITRDDLFGNPDEQAAFSKKYGRELKAPGNLEELLEVCQFFTRDTNADGKTDLYGTLMLGFPYFPTVRLWQTFLHLSGGRLFDEGWRPIFNSPEGIKSLQLYVDLEIKHKVAVPGSVTRAFQNYPAIWTQKVAATTINISGFIAKEFPVTLHPWDRPQAKAISLSINRHISPDRQEAALRFCEWFTSKDNQIELALSGLGAPLRVDAITDRGLLEKLPHFKSMAEIQKRTQQTLPPLPEVTLITDGTLAEMIGGAYGGTPVKEAVEKAAKATEEILAKAGLYKK